MSTTGGSSPLARGLPRGFPAFAPGTRIIPARAGFTPAARDRPHHGQDHPRSRGVYLLRDADGNVIGGSSPLARGLRKTGGLARKGGGIIPARAGFTAGPYAGARSVRDHPRSRGVYSGRTSPAIGGNGSSPLARGLRDGEDALCDGDGIIPARAGFTPPITLRRPPRTDHPRSRGVYGSSSRPSPNPSGSSPLARGLHRRYRGIRPDGRIIPARAGFTSPVPAPASCPTDHPRSRGVYVSAQTGRSGSRGSSPLARGLLT